MTEMPEPEKTARIFAREGEAVTCENGHASSWISTTNPHPEGRAIMHVVIATGCLHCGAELKVVAQFEDKDAADLLARRLEETVSGYYREKTGEQIHFVALPVPEPGTADVIMEQSQWRRMVSILLPV